MMIYHLTCAAHLKKLMRLFNRMRELVIKESNTTKSVGKKSVGKGVIAKYTMEILGSHFFNWCATFLCRWFKAIIQTKTGLQCI